MNSNCLLIFRSRQSQTDPDPFLLFIVHAYFEKQQQERNKMTIECLSHISRITDCVKGNTKQSCIRHVKFNLNCKKH